MSRQGPAIAPVWIGSAAAGDARGIYRADLDLTSGALGSTWRAAELARPTYLALTPDGGHVLAVAAADDDGRDPAVVLLRIADDGRALRELARRPSGGDDPAHVSVGAHGRVVFASNYGDGSIASFTVDDHERLTGPVAVDRHQGAGADPERQAGPHVHSATPFPGGRFLAVCDLGIDAVVIYAYDHAGDLRRIGEAPAPAGSGPRRVVWHPDGAHAFVIHELDQTLAAYTVAPFSGALLRLQTVSLWPDGAPPAGRRAFKAAEVAVHPEGRRVYASLRDAEGRGRDRLCVLSWEHERLGLVDALPAGVACPRHFGLTADGRWIVAAGMASDDLRVHRVDPADGRPSPHGEAVACPRPTCVIFGRPRPRG